MHLPQLLPVELPQLLKAQGPPKPAAVLKLALRAALAPGAQQAAATSNNPSCGCLPPHSPICKKATPS